MHAVDSALVVIAGFFSTDENGGMAHLPWAMAAVGVMDQKKTCLPVREQMAGPDYRQSGQLKNSFWSRVGENTRSEREKGSQEGESRRAQIFISRFGTCQQVQAGGKKIKFFSMYGLEVGAVM